MALEVELPVYIVINTNPVKLLTYLHSFIGIVTCRSTGCCLQRMTGQNLNVLSQNNK